MTLTRKASRRLAPGLGLLLAVSALTSCGSDSDGGSNVDASKLVTSMPAAGEDVDSIRWNIFGEPDTLDPRNAVSYGNGAMVRNMCEGVMQMDENFDVTPNLAEPEVVSPTELKLKVREGVTFWDGSPLTAEDVAYSLERSAAPDSVVSYGFIFVEDIKVTGDMEVTITFTQPDATFVDNLASLSGVVISKAWGEEVGDKVGTSTGGLMCTGPFEFGSWEPGSRIVIERNEDYWNAEELRPWAQQVEYSFVADDTALAQALEAGEIDGAYEVPVSILSKLQGAQDGELVFGPSTQSSSFYVAGPDGPLADLKLRDALNRVIDREAIADVVYSGGAEPNYTKLTPATWPNADRDLFQADYDTWAEERSYDLDAAQELVDASSYDGEEIVLAIAAGDQAASRIAQLFQQEAEKIGVAVSIDTLQPLVYDQAGYDASKRQGMDILFSTNFNSRQNPLEPLGYELLPGEAYNYTEYDNPQVTRLLNDARSEFDSTRRSEMVVEAQQIFEPASQQLPVVSTNEALFLNDGLTGAITSFAYWSMPQMAYIGAPAS